MIIGRINWKYEADSESHRTSFVRWNYYLLLIRSKDIFHHINSLNAQSDAFLIRKRCVKFAYIRIRPTNTSVYVVQLAVPINEENKLTGSINLVNFISTAMKLMSEICCQFHKRLIVLRSRCDLHL